MNDFEDREQVRLLSQMIMDQEGFETFAATRNDEMMCIVMGQDSEPEMDHASRAIMSRFEDRDPVRKVRIENAKLSVTVEPEPDDIHAAVDDALLGAYVHDYDISETFTVTPYGSEGYVGEG